MILKVGTWSSKYMYEVPTYIYIYILYLCILYLYCDTYFFLWLLIQDFWKMINFTDLQIPTIKVSRKKLPFFGVGCKNAPTSNGPRRH